MSTIKFLSRAAMSAASMFLGTLKSSRPRQTFARAIVSDRVKWGAAAIGCALPALIMTWCAPEVASWAYAITGAAVITATGGPAAYCAYRWWCA